MVVTRFLTFLRESVGSTMGFEDLKMGIKFRKTRGENQRGQPPTLDMRKKDVPTRGSTGP